MEASLEQTHCLVIKLLERVGSSDGPLPLSVLRGINATGWNSKVRIGKLILG